LSGLTREAAIAKAAQDIVGADGYTSGLLTEVAKTLANSTGMSLPAAVDAVTREALTQRAAAERVAKGVDPAVAEAAGVIGKAGEARASPGPRWPPRSA
jgi:hypothetical protein